MIRCPQGPLPGPGGPGGLAPESPHGLLPWSISCNLAGSRNDEVHIGPPRGRPRFRKGPEHGSRKAPLGPSPVRR
mgnify:CR=1 FL=1